MNIISTKNISYNRRKDIEMKIINDKNYDKL